MNIKQIIMGLLLTLASQACAQVVDGIAAVVEGYVVTFSEVRNEVDPIEQELRKSYQGKALVEKIKEARLKALDELINRKLIVWDFKESGYFLRQETVDERVQKVIDLNYGSLEAMKKGLAKNGMDLEVFRAEESERIIVQAMRSRNISQKASPQTRETNDPAKIQEERKRIEAEWLKELRKKAFIETFF